MCYKVAAALLLMVSIVASAAASEIFEDQSLPENGEKMTATFLLGDLLSRAIVKCCGWV